MTEMIQGVNTVLKDMPAKIRAFTIANPDMSYTIIVNSRLNQERQQEAYRHELKHIQGKDFYK